MKRYPLIAFIIACSAVAGYFIGARLTCPESMPVPAAAAATYVCPMHPQIVRDHPGNCPICGMELVRTDAAAAGAAQIHVDTATQQKLGVRLAQAARVQMPRDIHTYGTVVANEGAVLRITPTIDGVVQALHVHAGQHVAAGQLLYELASADALSLQYDYVDLLSRYATAAKVYQERRDQGRKLMAEAHDQGSAAREQAERLARQSQEQIDVMLRPMVRDKERLELRLHQIGLSDAMIQHLARTGRGFAVVPVRARQPCVVKEVMARPGMDVQAMTELFACVDTARPWLEIALYPDQLEWVREGDRVTIEPEDGDPVSTTLSGLDALLDPAVRVLRARVPVPAGVGRLGDYVDVTIHAAPREIVAVPRSALIRTGHGNYVMRAAGHGHFAPVKVITGIENDEQIAIRDGLSAGDQVVVNGQFLLDAAASMADAAQRMKSGGTERD